MTRNEALIQAIEFDMMHYHRQRFAQLAGLQMQMLREAKDLSTANQERLEALRSAMVETARNMLNTALTTEDVIEPLRVGVDICAINYADALMADPANHREP
ncbi:hypothetical protein [Pseudoxanthomonas sp.]|uniref:hypothetical protein n=1 Tax=Pseudoxanthomonas sp. TaxID=1871049 RepID=UPI002621B3A0|nr:hypothetical protein [Pseudoxanthomonas sp.]WDS36964.1 MAG: hypothetical protein O8I58_03380 [Pseudoxanthomonas sp.]